MAEEGGKDDLSSFYKYRQKFNNTYFLPVPRECKLPPTAIPQSLLTSSTVSFIHITDPYADDPPAQSAQRQPSSQYPPQLPPQQLEPQYVDVAATSLKAMIDPALEHTTGTPDQGDAEAVRLQHELEQAAALNQAGMQMSGANGELDEHEHDSFQDTIIKALRETNQSVENQNL